MNFILHSMQSNLSTTVSFLEVACVAAFLASSAAVMSRDQCPCGWWKDR
jgi:hypothetical protein